LGVSCPSSGSCLPAYVSFIFSWLIGLAGTIAVISFAIGAVGFMISGDNPELASSSKDRMKGAILGAVLTLASYLIIITINPALKNLNLTPLEEVTLPAIPTPPGVYYFSDSGCKEDSGIGSSIVSQDQMPSGVKAIKIVNDATSNYGCILHQAVRLENGGTCSQPITDAGACKPVGVNTGAIDIFKLNLTATPSGTGVSFYSEPFGKNRGSLAGFYNVAFNQMHPPYKQNPLTLMKYIYTGVVGADTAYKNKYVYFKDRPGSIDINGNYLVGIYSAGNYCQTFTKSVPNLNAQPVTGPGSPTITSVYIIPTK